jgi:hypothetical protein
MGSRSHALSLKPCISVVDPVVPSFPLLCCGRSRPSIHSSSSSAPFLLIFFLAFQTSKHGAWGSLICTAILQPLTLMQASISKAVFQHRITEFYVPVYGHSMWLLHARTEYIPSITEPSNTIVTTFIAGR